MRTQFSISFHHQFFGNVSVGKPIAKKEWGHLNMKQRLINLHLDGALLRRTLQVVYGDRQDSNGGAERLKFANHELDQVTHLGRARSASATS